MVTLANNHVLDYDEKGVEDTLTFCKKNGIQTVGAGMNLKEASKTVYMETKEWNRILGIRNAGDLKVKNQGIIISGNLFPVPHVIWLWKIRHLIHPGDINLLS